MRVLFFSTVAATILVAAGAVGWKAEAATVLGVGTLHFKQEAIHLSKRRPIGVVTIGVAITAMAIPITAMGTTALRLLRLWLETGHKHWHRARLGLALLSS